jgi:mono/diheme cytochrome c family protein
MKKFLKIALIAFAVIVFVVVVAVIYISSSDLPKYDVLQVDLKVELSPERIANGKRLSMMICNHCHLNNETRTLSGKRMADLPPEFGVVSSRNITRDPKYGIGSWSDGEIYFFLRTGINPKRGGSYVPPWMPKYMHAANEDLYDIIAYLRSDEPELTATESEAGPIEPSLLVKFLARVAFKPLPYPENPISRPDTSDLLAFGKYLADGMLGCFDCHAEDFKTMNIAEPEKSPGYYGGGNLLLDMTGSKVYSRNITSDKQHGIGNWTDEQFKTLIREGFRPDGSIVSFPMLRARFLSDNELDAIVAYIRSVPTSSKQNQPRPKYELLHNASEGEQLFYDYGCASCHGSDGKGYGDLTKAAIKYPVDSMLVDVIENPAKYWQNTLMPTWAGHIPEEEMKLIVAHVKSLARQ